MAPLGGEAVHERGGSIGASGVGGQPRREHVHVGLRVRVLQLVRVGQAFFYQHLGLVEAAEMPRCPRQPYETDRLGILAEKREVLGGPFGAIARQSPTQMLTRQLERSLPEGADAEEVVALGEEQGIAGLLGLGEKLLTVCLRLREVALDDGTVGHRPHRGGVGWKSELGAQVGRAFVDPAVIRTSV